MSDEGNLLEVRGLKVHFPIHKGVLVRRKAGFATMRPIVAGYLPVYAVWAGLVTFLLPLLFKFD